VGATDDTWEPVDNLTGATAAIEEFEAGIAAREKEGDVRPPLQLACCARDVGSRRGQP
jgi:hypothetical protein